MFHLKRAAAEAAAEAAAAAAASAAASTEHRHFPLSLCTFPSIKSRHDDHV
jgi:hypothetical protein